MTAPPRSGGTRRPGAPRGRRTGAGGFSLVELLIAMVVSIGVLGGAVAIASQVQSAYRRQLEAAAAQQEGRNALDWIDRMIRTAGNNPYEVTTTACPVAGTTVTGIGIDPDGDGVNDDIRLQSDLAPTNGLFGGSAGACTEPNEDVTIAYDAANQVVTLTDNNLGGGAVTRTDSIVTALQFAYLDSARNPTAVAAAVAFVQTSITVQTRTNDPTTNAPVSYTLTSEVRMRAR
ncbi:MAG: PilW family protein [Vicinamibacterales bacterium]